MKIEGACHPVISACPFNFWSYDDQFWNMPIAHHNKFSKQKSVVRLTTLLQHKVNLQISVQGGTVSLRFWCPRGLEQIQECRPPPPTIHTTPIHHMAFMNGTWLKVKWFYTVCISIRFWCAYNKHIKNDDAWAKFCGVACGWILSNSQITSTMSTIRRDKLDGLSNVAKQWSISFVDTISPGLRKNNFLSGN